MQILVADEEMTQHYFGIHYLGGSKMRECRTVDTYNLSMLLIDNFFMRDGAGEEPKICLEASRNDILGFADIFITSSE